MTTSPIANTFIGGVRIIASTQCVDYLPLGAPVRWHRKKRIRKKWLKRYGRRYIEVPKPDVLCIANGVLVGHPETIAKLQAQIERTAQHGDDRAMKYEVYPAAQHHVADSETA